MSEVRGKRERKVKEGEKKRKNSGRWKTGRRKTNEKVKADI